MKSHLRAAVLALPLALAVPARAAEPPRKAAPPAPAAGPAAKAPAAAAKKPAAGKPTPVAPADWKEFVAKDAAFSARFPGAPERTESPAGAMSLVAYAVERENPAPSFLVMVMSSEGGDLPPEMLDQVADGIVEKLGKNVTRNVPAKASGLPARDLAATGEEGSVAVRLVVAGTRLYQIMVLAKGPLADADVATFFGSFRTLP